MHDTLMISFSGGRTSAFMTNELLKEHKTAVVCFANTGKEEEETLLFVHQCNQLWGGVVVWLEYSKDAQGFAVVNYKTANRDGKPFSDMIDKTGGRFVPNVVQRYCTQELKVRVIKKYMLSLGHKYWLNVVGLRYDEPGRVARLKKSADKQRWENWAPLYDWKIVKADVLAFWQQMPFDLQLKEYQGNCDLCFLKGKNKVKQLLKEKPARAAWWIEQEERTGGRFHRDYTMKSLVDKIRRSPELFDVDNDIECFCNID